jgi:hypothetical protein
MNDNGGFYGLVIFDLSSFSPFLIRHLLVEKWECQFRNDMRRDAKLKAFCDARKLPTPQRPVSEKEILQAVANGRLFGMVECDIRVPD